MTNLAPDFTKRKFTITYFTPGDVLANMGGTRAAIVPFVNLVTPLLLLLFLYLLAGIIFDLTIKSQDNEENGIRESILQDVSVLVKFIKQDVKTRALIPHDLYS